MRGLFTFVCGAAKSSSKMGEAMHNSMVGKVERSACCAPAPLERPRDAPCARGRQDQFLRYIQIRANEY